MKYKYFPLKCICCNKLEDQYYQPDFINEISVMAWRALPQHSGAWICSPCESHAILTYGHMKGFCAKCHSIGFLKEVGDAYKRYLCRRCYEKY